MAVKISGLKPTISVPATLYLPVDGGEFAAHKFSVEFKRLGKARRDEINDLIVVGKKATGADGTEEVKRLTIPELLDEVVVGWGGMTGEDGSPVPYSHEERRATEEAYPGLEQAMAVVWFDGMNVHQRDAATKNSVALSGTTSASTAQTATS